MKKRFMKLTAVLLTVAMTVGSNGIVVPAAQAEEPLVYEADDRLILTEDESVTAETEAASPVTKSGSEVITDVSEGAGLAAYEDDALKSSADGLLEETVSNDQISNNADQDENGEEGIWDGEIPDELLNYQEIDLKVYESEVEAGSNRRGLPSEYNSKTRNLVPAIRNQNPFGTCWTFSTMASIEGSLIKQGLASKDDIDLAERALCYFFFNLDGIDDPQKNTLEDKNIPLLPYNGNTNIYDLGGNVKLASFFLANWGVPIYESKAPYSELVEIGKYGDLTDSNHKGVDALDPALCYDADYHVQNFRFIPKTDTDGIKQAIILNGVVSRSYYHDTGKRNDYGINFYNAEHYAYNSGSYHKDNTNHAVAVIGWKDDFPAEYFGEDCRPDDNGAWLIRNSWGNTFGDGGYMWISYEDESLGDVTAIDAELKDNYDNNYFYDGTSGTSAWGMQKGAYYVANVFKASSSETLKAVSIGVNSADVKYSLQIYKNLTDPANPVSGTAMLDKPQEGTFGYGGYYTVNLDQVIELLPGDTFSVVFDLQGARDTYVFTESSYVNGQVVGNVDRRWLELSAHTEPGQSFGSSTGSTKDSKWVDMNDKGRCFRIHAYTKNVADKPVHGIDPINVEIYKSANVSDYLGEIRAAIDGKYGAGEGAKWDLVDPTQTLTASDDMPVVSVSLNTIKGSKTIYDYVDLNVTDVQFDALDSLPGKAKVGDDPLELTTYASFVGYKPDKKLSYDYSSSDPGVISIDETDAYAYILKEGTATVSADLYVDDDKVKTVSKTVTVEKDSSQAFVDGFVVEVKSGGQETKTAFSKITDGYPLYTTGGSRYYIEDTTQNATAAYTSSDTSIVKLGTMRSDRRIEITPKGLGYVNVIGTVKGQDVSRVIRFRVYEPYISVSDTQLTINSALAEGSADLDIYNGYSNDISKVEIVDKNMASISVVSANYVKQADSGYGTAKIMYTGNPVTKTINGFVKILLKDIKDPVYKPIKLVIKNTVPKVTIKAISKVDNLYSTPDYSAGMITVTTDSGLIKSVDLKDTNRNKGPLAYKIYDDQAEQEGIAGSEGASAANGRQVDVYIVRKSETESKTARDSYNKGVLEVNLEGYRNPVKKNISIGYMTGKLKATVSNKSVLTKAGKAVSGNEIRINVTNTTAKHTESYVAPEVKIKDKNGKALDNRYVGEYIANGSFAIKPKAGISIPASGEEITVTITDPVHRNALNINKFKIKGVDKSKAGLKVSKSSIVVKYYGNKNVDRELAFETGLNLKDCGGLSEIISRSLVYTGVNDKSSTAVKNGSLSINYIPEDGVVRVTCPSGNAPEPGTYKYNLTLNKAASGLDKDITAALTVNVKKVPLKVSSKVKGKADVLNRDGSVQIVPKFTNLPEGCDFTYDSVTFTDAEGGTKGAAAKYDVLFDPDTGVAELSLKKDAKVDTREKHIFVFTYKVLTLSGTLTTKTGKIRIPVTQGNVKLEPVGRKTFSSSILVQKEAFAINAYNSVGDTVEVTKIELINPNKDFSLVAENGKYYIKYVPNGAVKRGKSYTLKFKVTLNGQAVNRNPVTMNYKVNVAK